MTGKAASAYQRQVVDDRPLGAFQHRQERMRHFEHSEEVDGQVLLDHFEIAQIVVDSDAGIVDEDVEGFNFADRLLDLRSVGHVQRHGCHAPVQVGKGLARPGVHPLRASPQCFLDQRFSYTAIGPGHQNCFVCDCHRSSHQI